MTLKRQVVKIGMGSEMGMGWNGMEWNGMEWNGNGVELELE